MADTWRDEAGLLALLQPGVVNGISAQDIRDVVYSLLRAEIRYATTSDGPAEQTPGAMYWDGVNLNVHSSTTAVGQLFEEGWLPVSRNTTGSTISNGTIVYVDSAIGQRPTIAPASNDGETAFKTIAVATEDIENNGDGRCTSFGVVRGIDTSAWAEGTEIFLGLNGAFTSTKPGLNGRVVSVGKVLYQHGVNGMVLVAIQRGRATIYPSGSRELRPLQSSTSFSDLLLWSWTDQTFPATTGKIPTATWTTEAYRDTASIQSFLRYDRDNQIHGNIQMPHEWAGTAVRLHFHTIPMANGDGDVYWSGSYYFGQVGEELPAAASWNTITATQAIVAADQYHQKIASIGTIDAPTTPGNSDVLTFGIKREGTNALDTYTTSKDHGTAQANMCLLSYDVHYQRLVTGSEEPFSGAIDDKPGNLIFDKAYAYGDDVYVVIIGKCDDGNEVEFRLYDVTGDAAVSGTVATTSTDWAVLPLGPLTLGDGLREYKVQARYTGTADEPKMANAIIVVR